MGLKPVMVVAAALLGLGALLHIVGLATPNWYTYSSDYTFGLWEACSGDYCIDNTNIPDWLKASQAFAVLGLVAGIIVFGLATASAVLGAIEKECPALIRSLTAPMAGIAFVTILVAAIIMAVKMKDFGLGADLDLGYSFGLSVAGALLIAIGGVVAHKGRQSISPVV